jgi:hypothetical protein
MAGDGQVTHGNTVMKHGARKVRRLYKIRSSPDSPVHGRCFHSL